MCGGNDRRHKIQYIVYLFIKPAPCSQTYNIPVYNNMVMASLLDVTLAHTIDYFMWLYFLYSRLPAISTGADDPLVASYRITWPVCTQ